MRPIYLDNNATTPMLPVVWEAMLPYFTDTYGNPASSHAAGRHARRALEDARERLAALLGAFPDEVVFTSGATEANNLALFGLAGDPPGHIIVSPIEHPSVSEPIERLAQLGLSVSRLPVNAAGIVRVEALHDLLRPDTRLFSVMLANHETGARQPISLIADYLANSKLEIRNSRLFHCDAVQAVGKVPVHFHALRVTTLSLSAHKFHGPKGIGALLIRRGTRLRPWIHGGHQQQGRRPGTEPVALVVGMARALELAHNHIAVDTRHVLRLRELFLRTLREHGIAPVHNGPQAVPDEALAHTLNLSFPGCQADALLMNLDLAGIGCSTGSACSSGSLLPSPVLRAMGVPDEVLHSAMRFSLSPLLAESDVIEAGQRIAEVVGRLRSE